MDVSGQQQMGVTSHIVAVDLDEKRRPVNVALSTVLEEVRCFALFSLEIQQRNLRELLWRHGLGCLLQHLPRRRCGLYIAWLGHVVRRKVFSAVPEE